MENDFTVFILSHNRPGKVYTFNSLLRHGFKGPVYVVIDNEDETADLYKKIFKEKLIIFNKSEIQKYTDKGDNLDNNKIVVFARNAVFKIAKEMNIKYFIVLDDDYINFTYKISDKNKKVAKSIKDINKIFEIMLNFYKKTNILSIAMAQEGDFVGGIHASILNSFRRIRKCMNSFICSTDRPFKFSGRINEDVNAYVNLGSKGNIFLTVPFISLNQKTTQHNSGGLTDTYLDLGTYVKSFYTVMYNPSSVKVSIFNSTHKRLHHKIKWECTVPCIINEKYKNSNLQKYEGLKNG